MKEGKDIFLPMVLIQLIIERFTFFQEAFEGFGINISFEVVD